jgi:transposase
MIKELPMPRPRTAMRKIRDVLRLRLGEQLSLRQVASSLSMPLTSVADYVRRATEAGLDWPLPEELSGDDALEARLFGSPKKDLASQPEPDFALVHAELRAKGVTLMLLWFEFKEHHPDGYSYSQFCRNYRTWRGHLDVVMRQDHKAGEKLFVDFPGMTIPIYDEGDLSVSFHAELFVAVLGASSYLYAEALRSQELEYWVAGHQNTFEFLGGCPQIVVPDNLRSGVSKAHRYEPDVNATYQEMATHYGVAIIPTRARKPRDKAKVEVGVQVAERWIIARLRKEHFTSLGALNEAILELVEIINNRPFKKMEGSRRALFEEIDQPALAPLPTERYEFATWKKARVNIDYHVEVERHYYSVPYRLTGEVVDVRCTATTIEVFAKNRRVASHKRSYAKGFHITDSVHMPDSHRRYAQWTPGRIIEWAAKNGPATASFVEELITSRPHPEQGFRSALGVIRLSSRYSPSRVEAACARASAVHSFSYKSVASILQHGLDQQPLRAGQPSRANPVHANVRGPNYYQ